MTFNIIFIICICAFVILVYYASAWWDDYSEKEANKNTRAMKRDRDLSMALLKHGKSRGKE